MHEAKMCTSEAHIEETHYDCNKLRKSFSKKSNVTTSEGVQRRKTQEV